MRLWGLFAIATIFALATGACAAPAGDAALSFEASGQGWEALSGQVTWDSQRPVQGKLCLSLTASADTPARAISDVLPVLQPGALAEMSFAFRSLSGSAPLSLWLAAAPGIADALPLWQAAPRSDRGWHRVALTVVCGLQAPRLLVAASAGSAWAVDDVRLKPTTLKPITRPLKAPVIPTLAPTLPAGWVPEGELDLRSREFMGLVTYLLQVGPLELRPPREIALRRGERNGFTIETQSLGPADKTLTTEVQGPPGWFTEVLSVELPGRRTLSLDLTTQAMVAGDATARIQFACGDDTRQMPLSARVTPTWPAFGVSLPAGVSLTPEQTAALAALPVQLVRQPADRPTDLARSLAADLVLADPSGPTALTPPACLAATAAAAPELPSDALRLSAPLPLRLTPTGLGADMDALLSAADSASALDLTPPALPASAVLRETFDGRPLTSPMASWLAFDSGWNPWALLNALQARRPEAQVLTDGLSGQSTGDPSLDALLLARAILHLTAWGTLGLTLPAQATSPDQLACFRPDGSPSPQILQVYSELSRELAAAVPLMPPPDTSAAGYLPGKPVTFRSFLRGDEGIVALWNNTAQRQSVAVEVYCMPFETRLLRLSWPGELVQREYNPDFSWDALARRIKQSAVYVDLEPLQVTVLSMRLRGAHSGWLREVGPRPQAPPEADPMAMEVPGHRD